MPAAPVLLSSVMATGAMRDARFYDVAPAFRPLQAKLATMQMTSRANCSSCKQRRIANNLFKDFVSILITLPPELLAGVKNYFKAEQLMLNMTNIRTGAIELKLL